ncbi:ribosomal protein L1p/L10e family [Rhizoctonia solani]|uniref:Ribosomal protein L1p/L10e family n=1 Tax=Rhizoctonia solani TaxID=456999 RepID=A0A8H8NQE8_9AGAM|nr:ribosomal protein L1p/L10e family [Rhizoctonia solani]QRW16566.1 ribosomal protein L1p/L10e family [Rhizoctonia solani]
MLVLQLQALSVKRARLYQGVVGRCQRREEAQLCETIELQIGLKNYDPQRDKRFSGTVKLPNVPRPRMSICILADAADIDRAKQIERGYCYY